MNHTESGQLSLFSFEPFAITSTRPYIGIGRENQFIKMAEKYNKQENEKVAFLYEIDLLKNSYQSTKVTKMSTRQVHVEIAKYHI